MPRPIIAIAVLQLLGGCAPAGDDTAPCRYVTEADIQEGIGQVRQRYGEMPGWLVPECEHVQPIQVNLLVDESEFPSVCARPTTGRLTGCSSRDINGDYHIWLLECQSDPVGTVAHEDLHNTLRCDTGDPDPNHGRSEWGRVAPR